jgi:MFS family permease
LRDDKRLARFVVARGFLVATALSPPYIVLIAGEGDSSIGELGFLVIASSAAAFLSTYAWGRMADRSSRRVLILSGLLGAAAMVGAVALASAGLAETVWAMPAALFVLMIAHHGVRQGRSIFIVDMAPDDRRASYAAAANTVIGVLLLVVGALGGALSALGPQAALLGFAVFAVIGAAVAVGLPEAEGG